MPGEGLEPTTSQFLAGCDNHYTTLPTAVWHNAYQALGSTLLTSILLFDYIIIEHMIIYKFINLSCSLVHSRLSLQFN